MGRTGVVRFVALTALLAAATAGWGACAGRGVSSSPDSGASATVTVARGTFERTVRVAGITEAIRAAAAVAPRLAGQSSPTLVITRLVKGGTRVTAGEVLVEFDPQEQTRAAFDRHTELQDLEQQIRRVEAQQAAAYASDETAMTQAANDVARARLEVRKNKVLPTIEAEKNDLALEEAVAREQEVREARMQRRATADAELKRLQIRRERAERALEHAEGNTQNMVVRAPFDGLIVMQPIFRGSALTEIQEGDEVRAGVPIAQIVDPSAMQVRVRVNQADAGLVTAGQAARVSLDAYPGSSFAGTVKQVAPLAITSTVTPSVRAFVALVTVNGSDPTLMPDLSAAADIVVSQKPSVLVVPRDTVVVDASGAWVMVKQGRSFARQAVTLGEVSDLQAVIASGVAEGAVLARRAAEVR